MYSKTVSGCRVNFHSFEEWEQVEWWNGSTLAVFDDESGEIDVLDPQGMKDALYDIQWDDKGYRPTTKSMLAHELVHFLQWKKGGRKSCIPLGLKVPIPEDVKEIYSPDVWIIEAEAWAVEEGQIPFKEAVRLYKETK